MSTLLRQYGADYVDHTDYPIGGGLGYKNTITQGDADYVVTEPANLASALAGASSGEIVFIPGDKDWTWTASDPEFTVPAGVTLASDRGVGGSEGAVLRARHTSTSSSFPVLFTLGAGARITGLRLQGPSGNPADSNEIKYTGVNCDADGCLVDNCHIWSMPYACVVFDTGTSREGTCRCCKLEFANRTGYGFGVQVGNGHSVLVEHCYIHGNQYGVSCVRGTPVADYEVRYCLFTAGNWLGCCQAEGGTDVSDCNVPAGGTLSIHHNTFQEYGTDTSVQIQGIPATSCTITGNWAIDTDPVWAEFDQVFTNSLGSILGQTFESETISGLEYIHVSVDDNWYGPAVPPQQTSSDPFDPPSQPGETPFSANRVKLSVMSPSQNVLIVKFPDDADLSSFTLNSMVHIQVEGDPLEYVYWGTIIDRETV